jgi:chromosomal replication initiator protein
VPDEVCEHVAQAVTTNIRELEGAILKLQANADLDRAPISLELARRVIGQAAPEPVAAPSIELIIQAVSDYYHVKRTEVLGKRRHKSVSLPRQMCMYLARHHTRHSLEEIGAHFGGRDHTTVMHAVRSVDARRRDDAGLEAAVAELEGRLRRGTART